MTRLSDFPVGAAMIAAKRGHTEPGIVAIAFLDVAIQALKDIEAVDWRGHPSREQGIAKRALETVIDTP